MVKLEVCGLVATNQLDQPMVKLDVCWLQPTNWTNQLDQGNGARFSSYDAVSGVAGQAVFGSYARLAEA